MLGEPDDPQIVARGGRPFTLFGLDLPLLAFIAIGGGFILLAIYWLFFTSLPLPRYCGASRHAMPCGFISRDSPSPVR
jgi:hypothetical protein